MGRPLQCGERNAPKFVVDSSRRKVVFEYGRVLCDEQAKRDVVTLDR